VSAVAPEQLRVFADYDGDWAERADVVVVGSGPTGAVAAYELARAGASVVMLEEGPPFTPEEFRSDAGLSMARTLREGGLRATRGTILPTMQAVALGGGSLVNSAICVRPPAFVLDGWAERFELSSTSRAELDPHFDAVGAFLGIAPTPCEVQGERNLVFRRGCDALGYSSEPIARNVRGCRGSGECFTGCRARAKQSMDVSYIPAALRDGLRVRTSTRVERVLHTGRRVTGVEGRVVAPFSGRPGACFRVEARFVVLAAGCMATPVLLRRSDDLANGSGQVGANLQFHPGVAVSAVFPESLHSSFGATQGYQSLEFLERGFKMETLWAPPAVTAVRSPGFGHALLERFRETERTAVFDAIAATHRSTGTVRARRRSLDPALRWHLHRDDLAILTEALYVLADVAFAAGAEKVVPGVHGLPAEATSIDQLSPLRRGAVRPGDLVIAGNHAFCTTRMHGDPARGVVDELGRCHDLDNLYIADTGIFPRCTAVNPMFTGMALAHRQARSLAERL